VHHSFKNTMAVPENEPTTLQTSLRSNADDILHPTPTLTEIFGHHEDFQPFTTYVATIITDAADLQSTPTPATNRLPISNATILTKKPIGEHVTRVGTVVSPTEIPEQWAPKDLQREQARQLKLVLGLVMMFLVVIAFVVGASVWQ